MSLDFLAEGNLCGQTLLRLVSRGSAIIAELLRLCDNIPTVFTSMLEDVPPTERDPMAAKYGPILFDFRYLKTPEMFDKQLNTSIELSDADEEFYETHQEVLARFYKMFEAIHIYMTDYGKYLQELEEGFYIQHTVEGVLLDIDGRQLLTEALYLQGVMMLLMDIHAPGPVRERIVVAHYRHKGESATVPIVELAKLCRDSGYRHNSTVVRRPANYPEDFLARYSVPSKVVNMVIGRLRSDDIYGATRVFPAPEHRSVALSQQASMLYVILYFAPGTLRDAKPLMREIVDKHFADNWILPVYMGHLVDLSIEWERYKAAREALAMDTLTPAHVRELTGYHRQKVAEVHKALDQYLTEGVLTESFVVDNIAPLIDTLRLANISLRWILLHRRAELKKWRDLVMEAPAPVASRGGAGAAAAASTSSGGAGSSGSTGTIGSYSDKKPILDFLLRTSLLEYKLKVHVKHLLAVKAAKWEADRSFTAQLLTELAEYFSGSRALTRVEKDEGLMSWFTGLATEVKGLDYGDAVLAGRKIRQLIKAFEEVTAFDVIDTSTNVKDYLGIAKEKLTDMVRTINITEQQAADIGTICDFSYAWEIMREFVGDMHDRIRADPAAVRLLRAAFLKLTSVLEVPLVRIYQANSPDKAAVSEYYSGELVAFLRTVMEVIPVIVFSILKEVISLQTRSMKPMPVRVELIHLRDLAQLDARTVLARRTHEISIFTEGILAMEKTLLGVIQVDPRQILNDGIRKHLVDQISRALHTCLAFDTRGGRGRDPKASVEAAVANLRETLDGFRKSFEYVQDYIGVYGLRMWQEEFTRITGFNTEAEANRFVRRKVLPEQSKYQSRAIPLPLFTRAPPGDASSPGCITFMGRLTDAVLQLTHPSRSVYGPGSTGGGWYDPTGREIVGVGLFSQLRDAMGSAGMVGLDKLVGFHVEAALTIAMRGYAASLKQGADRVLTAVMDELQPTTMATPNVLKTFSALSKKLVGPMNSLLDALLAVGHAQLVRRAIAHELRFACRLDSNLLCGALEGVNAALLTDIRRHYYNAEAHPLPDDENPLIAQVAKYCEAAGINDPLTNIYLNVEAAVQPPMGLWLAIFTVTQISRFMWDREFGTLTRRKATDPVDGAPLVAGLVTLLKQMHPRVTDDYFAYMGQYLRSVAQAAFGDASSSTPAALKEAAKAPPTVPPDVVNIILLLQQVGRVAHVPDRVLHAHVPPYMFDSLMAPANAQ